MSVTVIEQACEPLGTNQAKIVVEAASVEEALGTRAKEAAIQGAKRLGLARAGISNQSGPYPVNEAGVDCTLNAQPGMRYRNDFTITERI